MHRTQCGETTFHHDGGFDGDVIIRRDGQEITIRMDELLDFAGAAVASALISRIEQMSGKQLLAWLAQVKSVN
jgi:hypothetical protein